MYVWNIFPIVGRSPDLLKPILELIEKNEKIERKKLMKIDLHQGIELRWFRFQYFKLLPLRI